jgi:sugar phosphate isomerase/epimerase
MPHPLPAIGCAIPVDVLPHYRDWIIGQQRDVELQSFFSAETLDSDWHPLVAEAKKHLDGYTGRLGIHGPFWGFKIDSHDAEIRAVVKKRFMQGLDVCAAVGATQMVIHSPYTTWDYNNLDNNPGSRGQITERVHKTIGDVVKRAESMGCVLVIENIEDIDPRIRVDLVKSFNSPAVRVSIDTGHAHYAHGSTGAPPVDYYVEAAGELLDHVHIQDADGYADRHWAPGEGTILWPSVFRAIAKLTVKPRLVLELKDKMAVRKGADHLAALGLVV